MTKKIKIACACIYYILVYILLSIQLEAELKFDKAEVSFE